VTRLFDKIARRRGFRFFLNVEVGNHLSHADLIRHHHAVLYAVGAPNDKRLDIDGMGLPGSGTATELVAWINVHPDFTDLPVDLGHERVVVVGNGNVAFDVARILTADPADLARTDISDRALTALRGSAVREVVIAARRGPAQSAFTLPELIGLASTAEVVLDAADHALVRRDLATTEDPLTRNKLEILSKLGDASAPATRPRIRLAYQLTPQRIIGPGRVTGIEFGVTGTGEVRRLDTGLVLSSIGYRGKPVRDLPFDEAAGVVPNDGGRVVDPGTGRHTGTYVAGWIKRGPTGFIGTNKSCALETVQHLVDDFNAGLLPPPTTKPAALDQLVRTRQPEVVDAAGWWAIDAAENERGSADGRPRDKFTDIAEMLAAAATAPKPAARLSLIGRLRRV
jgi:ferredoxin/flavodoxin---NADP+ reductase